MAPFTVTGSPPNIALQRHFLRRLYPHFLEPPFQEELAKRHFNLVLEILRALYVLKNVRNNASKSQPSDDTTVHIGIIL